MIIFSKIRYKNLLSTGNKFIELNLNEHKNTLCVGKNGEGKSILNDALTFVLFGKAFRNIPKNHLINFKNNKDLLVEIEFEINNTNYKIVRGLKPNIFEIYVNDSIVQQDSNIKDYQKFLEENILKMDYKSFTQIVILGSRNYVPFMQLPLNSRRIFVERILNIENFSIMYSLNRNRLSEKEKKIEELQHEINLVKNSIQYENKILKNIVESQKKNKNEIEKKIKNNEKTISEYKEKIKDISSKKEIIQNNLSISKLNNEQNEIINLEKDVKSKIKEYNEKLSFFESNDNCPTCNEPLKNKENYVSSLSKKLNRFKSICSFIDKKKKKLKEHISLNKKLQEKIMRLDSRNNEINNEVKTLKKNNEFLFKEIQKENKKEDENKHQEELKKLNLKLEEKKKKLKDDYQTKKIFEYTSSLLKDDGIKTIIIKDYLSTINTLINKFLNEMNLNIYFKFDEEFNEHIIFKNNEYRYENFSEGQKLRIDLAILFTWREITRLKNSTNCNLIIFDEILDSSLDMSGIDDFLRIITSRNDSILNTIIISHKTDTIGDKFENVLQFERKMGFTTIQKIS